jgi:choline-sulfatase
LQIDPTPTSFGSALAKQGVHSAYIGKSDAYAPSHQLGFSEMIYSEDRASPGDTNHRRNATSIRKGAAERANGFGPKEEAGTNDIQCVDQAIRWIEDTAPGLDSPWVLVVNIFSPHFPHIALPEFWDMYSNNEDMPQFGAECESAQHPYAQMLRKHFETDQFSEKQIRGLRRGYYACITFADQQLGRLTKALESAYLNDSTNIVYSSDHGEMLGKFGMWWKCSLYEDSVRIPMLVAGPDFAEGKRITTPVDLHDLQASLFAATGVEHPPEMLGEPLQSMPSDDADRVVFSEYHGHGAPGSSYMIRKGQWKYIFYSEASSQLFNLEDDPDELSNLAEIELDVVTDLDAELRKICSPEGENERAEQFIEMQLEAIEKKAE